jgi:hypothetical protein
LGFRFRAITAMSAITAILLIREYPRQSAVGLGF